MKTSRWLPLVGFLLLSLAAGAIGSLSTFENIPSWYVYLNKPALTPPNWVFGPVWTTLYILIGIAAFLVWERAKGSRRRRAMVVFCLQLALNALWSVLFFGMQSPLLGAYGIVALWLSIALTIRLFAKSSRTAAWLMAPYLAWVSFASYLNFSIYFLNQ